MKGAFYAKFFFQLSCLSENKTCIYISSIYLFQGPSTDEVKIEVDDIKLLRIARLLHPDNMMPISASLVGNVQFLRKLEQQYQGFNPSDFAFMLLHEWKISNKNRRQAPTVALLLEVFEDLHIDKHHLCQVYHMTGLLLSVYEVPRSGINSEYLLQLRRQLRNINCKSMFTTYARRFLYRYSIITLYEWHL